MSDPGGNPTVKRTSVAVELDAAWSVGSAMFGGAVLRQMAAGAAAVAGVPDWIAIEVSGRFLRPVPAGRQLLEVSVLHLGRTSRVAEARLHSDGRTSATATITWSPRESLPLAGSGTPETLPPAAEFVEHELDAVARRVDWRVQGTWGPSDGPLRSWIALRDDPGPASADLCLVAADLLVPALPGARIDLPLRIASISLHVSVVAIPSSRWLAQETVASRIGDSGAHATIRLSAPDGTTIGRALHRAVLLPAERAGMPYSATAFGMGVRDSSESASLSVLS